MLSKNAIELLTKRYCRDGENPYTTLARVANNIYYDEEDELKRDMENGLFFPNSPAIFNAGYSNMMHACCALGIEDNMKSIADFMYNMTMMFKYGAGVGANYSRLRSSGEQLSSGGSSSGVISLMNVIDSLTNYVKQGGYRRGANMSILNFDHPEIINFCNSKLKGGFENMNLSVMVTDDFMNKIDTEDSFRLIDPSSGKDYGKMKYRDLFDIIAFCAWSCGCPGLLFFDRINKDNPYYPDVIIDTCNPCITENGILLDGEILKKINSNGSNWDSWETGTKETLRLKINNGIEIECTPDHLIKTENGWKQAKDTIGENIEWCLGSRKATRLYENIVIQGFLFGDGFRTGNSIGCSVRLNKKKENEIYNKLIDFGFKEEKCGYLYINRNRLPFGNEFLDYKLPYRDIPEYVLFSDSNYSASFLRGLFEANGSCNKLNGQISFKSTNNKLVKDIQIILASFGIPSWITKNKKQKIKWLNGTYISRESYNLQIAPRNVGIFMDKIGFVSGYKKKNIKEITGEYKTKLKVKSITNIGLKKVYDFRMKDGSGQNFCNGITVHNCAESPIPTNSLCCLGSINLSNFVNGKIFDYEMFEEKIKLYTKVLLNMNKIGWYPFDFMKEAMDKFKPIGLGVMGFADALIKMEIYYDSQASLDFIDSVGEIYKNVTDDIAKDSFYKRIIAPTGSLSILADCSSGIEPVFSEIFERNLTVGKIEETRDIYKSRYTRVSHNIEPEWHLKVQAKWQEWVDGGISKTINLPSSASIRDVKNIYRKAWKLGTKGITVYRNMSKDHQVLYAKGCEGETCYL